MENETVPASRYTSLISIYTSLWSLKFTGSPAIPGFVKFRSQFKPFLISYNNAQVTALVLCHLFGGKERERSRLDDAMCPIGWLIKNSGDYEQFLRTSYNLDFDNEQEVWALVHDWYKSVSKDYAQG